MRHQGFGGRANIQKKCPCGSGKKQKNCHGFPGSPRPMEPLAMAIPGNPPPATQSAPTTPGTNSHPWGMPGEDHKVWVAPIMQGSDRSKINLAGSRGRYKVQFLLSRPGYPITPEREHKFIDDVVGESHIRITKPKAERQPQDVEQLLIQTVGNKFQFIGSGNDEGLLGKFVAEFESENMQTAENEAYGALAPALSAWSLNADVPVSIETIQVTDLTTHVSSLRVRTPHFEMNFGGEFQLSRMNLLNTRASTARDSTPIARSIGIFVSSRSSKASLRVALAKLASGVMPVSIRARPTNDFRQQRKNSWRCWAAFTTGERVGTIWL